MFKDTFFHSLDEAGRLAIPAKWRKNSLMDKGATLIATRGLDTNLFLFTEQDWNRYVESRVAQLPVGEDSVRDFLRFFFSGASECVVDRSGRIMLPENLLGYGRLKKDVVLNGSGFYVEIWDRDLWNGYFAENQERLKTFAKDFFRLPIQGKGHGEDGTQERPG
jgi:MraZ protein